MERFHASLQKTIHISSLLLLFRKLPTCQNAEYFFTHGEEEDYDYQRSKGCENETSELLLGRCVLLRIVHSKRFSWSSAYEHQWLTNLYTTQETLRFYICVVLGFKPM